MRKLATCLLAALLIAACNTASHAVTATAVLPAAVSSPAPTSTTSASQPALFFDHFDMSDARSGWAWKGASQLYRTDDGGATWVELHLQGKRLVTGASFLSAREAWLPGVADAELKQPVYHTSDGGMSWQALPSIAGPNLELHFHDSRRGWALNGIGATGNIFYQVYQTTDGGQTWTHLQIAGEGQAPMAGELHTMTGDSVTFTSPATIWVSSGSGLSTSYAGLRVSRDAGTTWQDINPPFPAEYVVGQPPVFVAAPQFISATVAYLPVTVGQREVLFVSRDGGVSWQLLPASMPASPAPLRVQFVNEEDGFAMCATSLCATHDSGASWQQVPTPFAFGKGTSGPFVSEFDFVDDQRGWAILLSTDGGASFMHTDDGGRTWLRMNPRLGF